MTYTHAEDKYCDTIKDSITYQIKLNERDIKDKQIKNARLKDILKDYTSIDHINNSKRETVTKEDLTYMFAYKTAMRIVLDSDDWIEEAFRLHPYIDDCLKKYLQINKTFICKDYVRDILREYYLDENGEIRCRTTEKNDIWEG